MANRYTWRQLARDLREGPYTSFGCYPKFWVAKDGSVLSYAAIMADPARYMRATAARTGSWPQPDYCIVGCDVNWEDPSLYCDDTGERIPSAYAEPEEPAYIYGSGMRGCLYDNGPHQAESLDEAIASLRCTFSELNNATWSRVERDIRKKGIHYFDRRLRPFVGADYCEVSHV